MEISEAVEQFLRDCENKQLTPSTLLTYRQRFRVWLQLLATVCKDAKGNHVVVIDLERVTVDYLRQCVQHMLKFGSGSKLGRAAVTDKLSANSVRSYILVCKSFFNWCYQEELIDANPVERLKSPKVPSKVTATFSDEQIHKMLSVCDPNTETGFRDYVILLLLLDTGVRLSELCHIHLENVHPEYVKIEHGKGRKEREVGISPEIYKLLWKYINKYRHPINSDEKAFFIGRGVALQDGGVQQLLDRVKKDAGFEDIRFSAHVFRHTFSKRYKDNGGDTLNLSRELGHSSVRITEIYLQNFGSTEARKDHTKYSPVSGLQLGKYAKQKRPKKRTKQD
ncbi:MAG: tyrosine-type recombinase/integrase [Ktedonobacteraceae bacterium]|nr:tyrosine-type recombinase/integrase [Ktedonobacteraceae bacterium]